MGMTSKFPHIAGRDMQGQIAEGCVRSTISRSATICLLGVFIQLSKADIEEILKASSWIIFGSGWVYIMDDAEADDQLEWDMVGLGVG